MNNKNIMIKDNRPRKNNIIRDKEVNKQQNNIHNADLMKNKTIQVKEKVKSL